MQFTELKIDGYHRVIRATDKDFCAIVGIHNINLGTALGGCRVMAYDSEEAQLEDALRLSKGMTYKNALAGLKCGGGKATINAPKATAEVLDKFAEVMDYINKYSVEYITAGDVGTGPQEVAHLRERTEFVNGQQLGQDSGYATAFGVYMAMLGALNHRNRELRQQDVFVEGLGKVGMRLTKFLKNEAKHLFVTDPHESRTQAAFTLHEAVPVRSREDGLRRAGVYSPCALGGVLDWSTLDILSPGDIVVGGANNLFMDDEMDVAYASKGIVVVPDYLANAGGVIIVTEGFEDAEWDDPGILEKLRGIKFTTENVLEVAQYERHTPMFIANRMAEGIFNGS